MMTTATRPLKIGGFVPFSTADYPGKLAAVVFVQGCPWQCVYCHNPHLQARTEHDSLTWEAALATMKRRQGLLDAVVFSGGEPTLDPALPDAMRAVRELGFDIALHTGGAYPKRLEAVLPLVNWIGLDIKAPFTDYEKITGAKNSGESARACLELLLASGKDFECRTTAHPDLITEAELLALGRQLSDLGVKHYAVQIFRQQGCLSAALAPVTDISMQATFLPAMESLFHRFALRKD